MISKKPSITSYVYFQGDNVEIFLAVLYQLAKFNTVFVVTKLMINQSNACHNLHGVRLHNILMMHVSKKAYMVS